ncbi:winged helix-turn-helix domain-containing protein [Streptomyces tsukubensis]|uniref:HTH gntR-type domain-containing protein n=1 Tax=Streptomyces tsukubensis TaxID=83656 RepID=A0A1V4A8U2_9ACTN|nr:GntR family transcriptional regulator [Streptomyces tsukubensis]OON78837.1 hypothetical protein B1H18_15875 [Streptomyces tsukubensis]QFR94313.1 GntR family transcriptional regulator [Streptomyces tsukubensis]
MTRIENVSAEQIADRLRQRIRDGDLRPGARLPTQVRLAEEFDVERGQVRRALDTLRDEGLISTSQKGRPSSVATVAPPAQGPPQPTMATLGPRLIEAFSEPYVRIDAICLMAETLTAAMGEPVEKILRGEISPDRVEVRLLLPSNGIDVAFPAPRAGWGADAEVDELVRRRGIDLRNAQLMVLRHSLEKLRGAPRKGDPIKVDVSFREVTFTPHSKLYLLNGRVAMFGYYMAGAYTEEIKGRTVELTDVRGTLSPLVSFDERSGGAGAAFVEQSRTWFESHWAANQQEFRRSAAR